MTIDKKKLVEDAALTFLSVLVAFTLVKTGLIGDFLSKIRAFDVIGSFVAGAFFTSVFTVAPATVILGEIARSNLLWLTALVGATGAMLGDLVVFRFFRDRLAEDFLFLFGKPKSQRLKFAAHSRVFKWIMPLFGALIIASPLPDELGLALFGITKTKLRIFIPLSFAMNFFGILTVGIIARSL